MSSPLLDLLHREKIISVTQYKELLILTQHHSIKVIDALMDKDIVSPTTLAQFLADYFTLPYYQKQLLELPSHFSYLHELIREHMAIPLNEHNHQITLAVLDPTDPTIEQDFAFASGKKINLMIMDWEQMSSWFKCYTEKNAIAECSITEYLPSLTDDSYDINDNELDHDWEQNKTPVTQCLYQILIRAYQHQASDIHFEPFEHQYRVRMRIDGILSTQFSPDKLLSKRLTTRIKVLAHLNIAERRHPQDGRFKVKISDHQTIDLRVSTLPTLWGEKIVLRLLNAQHFSLDSRTLGLSPSQVIEWHHALFQPQGLILVTGPTGSGKTLTLYSGLSELDANTKNITTIEDPIEIQLKNINQVQINSNIQLNFSDILRSILRQDPDVIMIGEIRDQETALMAFRAAQTGHLVLSTLHTNSAIDSISRLRQLGIPNDFIQSCTNIVIAQRLVRRLCPHCKIASPLPTELNHEQELRHTKTVFKANTLGCHQCHRGYKGRVGLFETLPFNSNNKTVLFQSNGHRNQPDNMQTLWSSGVNLLRQGDTSFSELLRVLEYEKTH